LLYPNEIGFTNNIIPKAIIHNDHGRQESNCTIAPPLNGPRISWGVAIRTPAVMLSNPHIICEAVIATTPIRSRARVIHTKKAAVDAPCIKSQVRGNTPMSKTAIEPRRRLTIASRPSRPDRRHRPRPMANIRLNILVKISPPLNNVFAEPSTPNTLIWFSVQLNQGELEIATSRAVRPTS